MILQFWNNRQTAKKKTFKMLENLQNSFAEKWEFDTALHRAWQFSKFCKYEQICYLAKFIIISHHPIYTSMFPAVLFFLPGPQVFFTLETISFSPLCRFGDSWSSLELERSSSWLCGFEVVDCTSAESYLGFSMTQSWRIQVLSQY